MATKVSRRGDYLSQGELCESLPHVDYQARDQVHCEEHGLAAAPIDEQVEGGTDLGHAHCRHRVLALPADEVGQYIRICENSALITCLLIVCVDVVSAHCSCWHTSKSMEMSPSSNCLTLSTSLFAAGAVMTNSVSLTAHTKSRYSFSRSSLPKNFLLSCFDFVIKYLGNFLARGSFATTSVVSP